MFNKLLGNVDGADRWLILSLIIFGLFFVGVIFYLILMKKDYSKHMKNIPLGEEDKN